MKRCTNSNPMPQQSRNYCFNCILRADNSYFFDCSMRAESIQTCSKNCFSSRYSLSPFSCLSAKPPMASYCFHFFLNYLCNSSLNNSCSTLKQLCVYTLLLCSQLTWVTIHNAVFTVTVRINAYLRCDFQLSALKTHIHDVLIELVIQLLNTVSPTTV